MSDPAKDWSLRHARGEGAYEDAVRRSVDSLLPDDRSASDIFKQLDPVVKGQGTAKRHLSVLLSMHLSWFNNEDSFHRSPNALLIGPTGVGKTHSIKMAASYLHLPYVLTDATSLVPSGIVGLQIEDLLEDLVAQAGVLLAESDVVRVPNDDIELARRGIIFVDEFDKLKVGDRPTEGEALNRLVQRRLLKLSEGSVMGVGTRQHTVERPVRSMDTSGILLIASGAFQGIDNPNIRSKRPQAIVRTLRNPDRPISADVVNFGFLPELVARFPLLIRYNELSASDLHSILVDPKVSPVMVWTRYLSQRGCDLQFEDDALRWVAAQAVSLSMGARGLQQILFPVLADIAYELESTPRERITLSRDDFARASA